MSRIDRNSRETTTRSPMYEKRKSLASIVAPVLKVMI
jgi:hypothetical protein